MRTPQNTQTLDIYIKNNHLEISNPEKILFPRSNISKKTLLMYYYHIASYMIPYLQNRPVVLQRYPDGIDKDSFFQKNAPDYFPDWIKTVEIEKKEDGFTRYVICQNTQTLLYLANLATIIFHTWLSNINHLEQPDRLIFDLDPSPEVSFDQVIHIAFIFKDLLTQLNLEPYVMTTGSKGLHIVVPLQPNFTFDQVQQFAYGCATVVLQREPKLTTLEISKEKRKGKVFIDTLRNQFGSLAVAPYSIRAIEHAPVATPLFWQELRVPGITSQEYTITTIFSRLQTKQNPWHNFLKNSQPLQKSISKLITMLS